MTATPRECSNLVPIVPEAVIPAKADDSRQLVERMPFKLGSLRAVIEPLRAHKFVFLP
jgi:hypothetical protein